jgi:hypothetical protein
MFSSCDTLLLWVPVMMIFQKCFLPGMVAHSCNSSTWQTEAGESQTRGKASLGHTGSPVLEKQTK